MKRIILTKLANFLLIIAVITQLLSPYAAFFIQPAYAQDVAQTTTTSATTTDQSTPTVTPTIDQTTITPTAVSQQTSDNNESLSVVVLNNVSAPSIDLSAVEESGSAVLTTDKPDYAPTDTALITGSGLVPNTQYSLHVWSDDTPPTNTTANVTSDNSGVFAYAYQLDGTYRPNYSAELKDSTGAVVAATTFTDAAPLSVDPNQCANGAVGSTPVSCAGNNWVTGNVNAQKAHWFEGDFLSYRAVIKNLDAGSGSYTFSFDTTKGGKHAIDYLGSFDATETTGAATSVHANLNDPCGDVSGLNSPCVPSTPTSQATVLTDSTLNSFPTICASNTFTGAQASGAIKAWGLTGLSFAYGTQNVGSNDCTTTVTVSWTGTSHSTGTKNVVIAFGGHVAKQSEWGSGNSAVDINGSPYHVHQVSLSSNGVDKGVGSQDLQLAADAIIIPGTINIVKNTVSADGTFSYVTTGNGLSDFGITTTAHTGNRLFTSLIPGSNGGSRTVSESVPSGWSLTGLNCTSANGTSTSTTNLGTGMATVSNLGAGDTVTCTYTNTLQQAHLTLVKVVTNNNGGTKTVNDFPLAATGPSTITGISGNSAVTNAAVNSGTYTLSETNQTGYTPSLWTCTNGVTVTSSQINLAAGQSTTCTITNDDNAAHLIVIKHVVNNNGGTKAAGDFDTTISGVTTASPTAAGAEAPGVDNTLTTVGPYSVDEGTHTGYDKTLSSDCSGTIALGQTKTCTITNDDIAPTLKLVKVVTNNNGGDKQPADWTLSATGTDGFSDAGNSITFHSVDANTSYALSESVVAGYDSGTFSCDGGNLVGQNLTLGLGDHVTCTVTNDDQAAHLIIVKNVINDNGGIKVAGDFSGTITGVTVSGGNTWAGTVDPGTNKTLTSVGTYNVVENADGDYNTSYSADCSGSIALGQTKTCTVTNNDKASHLIVIKHVVNDNGGTKTAGDFNTTISGVTTASPTAAGAEDPGVNNVLTSVGSYSVDEGAHDGYSKSLSADCSGSIGLGETKTCTITNDDSAPSLTLNKILIKNNGGTAVEGDWTLSADGPTSIAGPGALADADVVSGSNFHSGTYGLSESAGPSGYAPSGWTCTGDVTNSGNQITLGVGQSATCTITNDDQPAHLIVIKHVINDDGDTAAAADFTMNVTGTNVSNPSFPGNESGVNLTLNAGSYNADEVTHAGYTETRSADCTGTIANGETRTCTITNNDLPHATRTQGFWQTHTNYTLSVIGDLSWNIGTSPKIITKNNIFSAFYASISKKSDGKTKRSALDQARMQMLQQWVAAKLNCGAFGCSVSTQNLLSNAASAWAGTNTSLILSYAGQLDTYNNSNDALPISGQGKATPTLSQTAASSQINYWDTLP